MKRTRWKISEIFSILCAVEGYRSASENASYCRKKLNNEVFASKWDREAELEIKKLEAMGLTDIISEIKRLLK